MKTLLLLTATVGLFVSTSQANFCLKKYSSNMNRYAASTQKTNFYNISAKSKTTTGAASNVTPVRGHK